MRKKALITGITGQDGLYLTCLLLSKGYAVHGLVRRSSTPNTERIAHLLDQIQLHQGDMTDAMSLDRVVATVLPDEVYNLAAQSQVGSSFQVPEYTLQVNGAGVLSLLSAVRRHVPNAGFYQASTSEMFGSSPPPQNEETPLRPRSPYGAAKVYAYNTVRNFREAYGMFAVNGILFNHESEWRGEEFVSRKITKAVAKIRRGLQKELFLGNLEAERDWGHAQDYVLAMWMMLQHADPDDFVVGTGITWSVLDFVKLAFAHADLDWRKYVRTDPNMYRDAEVYALRADASKAREVLGWEPKVSFETMVTAMVDHDLVLLDAPLPGSL